MNKKVINTICLDLPEGKDILSGKEVGMYTRKEHSLDNLDDVDGIVEVRILAEMVSSSFILGMFSQSVRKLGKEGFFKKYNFDAPDDIMENIRVNVEYSATEGTALG